MKDSLSIAIDLDSKIKLKYRYKKINDYFFIEINLPSLSKLKNKSLKIKYNPINQYKEIISDELLTNDILNEINDTCVDLPIQDFINKVENNLNSILNIEKPMVSINRFKYPATSVNPNVHFNRYVDNIIFIVSMKLNVIIECNKCKKKLLINSDTVCEKCYSTIKYNYVPFISDDFLGFLAIKGGNIIEFVGNKYKFKCNECGSDYETCVIEKKDKFIQNCFKCNIKLKIEVINIYVVEKQKILIKEGTELPNRGACTHYQKSLRWFRFPCCNLLFPCDTCHNINSKHSSELANKMVCGLCSKEQSVKSECKCGMNLIKRNSQFWEGGKGNRNKQSLSKNDKRKFKK